MTQALTTLTNQLADTLGMGDGTGLVDTLKATAFRSGEQVTNDQMVALMVVANQYKLNPWTKEIYAFPDKKNGIVPVVGVDGWSRIINSHSQFDGMDFIMSENIVTLDGAKPAPEWIECVIYRKDRSHPIKVREYLDEVYRPPFEGNGRNGKYKINGPWQSHTKRFLRHKSTIQCARMAFGFVGIYDQDEAERIESSEINDTGATEVQSEPVMYPQERFDKVIDRWADAIASGKKTNQECIDTLSSKGKLTEEMVATINAFTLSEPEVVEGEIVEKAE